MIENMTGPIESVESGPEAARVGSLTPDERETIIRISDGDGPVRIDTTRRVDITALRKKPDATETGSGFHGTTAWATFTIPKNRWSTGRGVKSQPREMTEEQRAALADRLRRTKEARA